MSVLIKGMKMPSVCDCCWALDESGDYPMCRITGETRGYNFRVREKRMDRCPFIESPEHGDLHEVACLIADLFGDPCACNFNGIDEWLPTYCDFSSTCCPHPDGVACWEQYLKHLDKRHDEVSE